MGKQIVFPLSSCFVMVQYLGFMWACVPSQQNVKIHMKNGEYVNKKVFTYICKKVLQFFFFICKRCAKFFTKEHSSKLLVLGISMLYLKEIVWGHVNFYCFHLQIFHSNF